MFPCRETEAASPTFPLEKAVWANIWITTHSVRLHGARTPTWTDYKDSSVLAFSDQAAENNEEIVYFALYIPARYKEDTHIHLCIDWVGEDATAGDVVWKMTYSRGPVDGVFPGATAITKASANSPVADTHIVSHFDLIDGTGFKVHDVLLCSLRRNSSNVLDTFAGKDAYFLGIDVHFQADTLGTRTIYIKY